MKNYVIAVVVIVLIIGAIVYYRGRNVTPVVDTSDVTATTTVDTIPVATTTGTTTAQ